MSEVALALMLLIGAGLLMRSLSGLRSVDPGFDAEQRAHGDRRHSGSEVCDAGAAQSVLRSRAAERPRPARCRVGGVDRYLAAARRFDAVRDGRGDAADEGIRDAGRGRTPGLAWVFPHRADSDAAGPRLQRSGWLTASRAVVIVSENTAKRFWPGENPLGKRITLTMMTKEAAEVVGVVREVKTGSLDASEADSETAVYAPPAQFAFGGSTLAVRTATDPRNLTRALVNAIHGIDPEQPVLDIATLEEVVEESLGQRPLAMMLLAAFAVLALVLASVGIYSVLAYTVRQRVREIGIRLALGAPVHGVLRLVVVEGLKPTLVGVALGLALAAGLVRVMTTLLYGVSQHDPGTFTRGRADHAGRGHCGDAAAGLSRNARGSDRDAAGRITRWGSFVHVHRGAVFTDAGDAILVPLAALLRARCLTPHCRRALKTGFKVFAYGVSWYLTPRCAGVKTLRVMRSSACSWRSCSRSTFAVTRGIDR